MLNCAGVPGLVCLGLAATEIRAELDISKEGWGWVIAAFSVSYGLLEIPSGAWGDRFGHRADSRP